MHNNHSYLLHWAHTVTKDTPGARILDYGCGAGEVVVEGRRQGLDVMGADAFYEGASSKRQVENLGLLGTFITEIENGKLAYENGAFDLVLSNQVIEHAADLDAVLAEISRVMKPTAKLLCIFPTKEVVREGHIGIPFVHWFPKKSSDRFLFVLTCRAIGLGYFKQQKPMRQWTTDALDWIDKYTFYRSREDLLGTFQEYFALSAVEPDYARFRIERALGLEQSEFLSRTFASPPISRLARAILHRLTGVVLLASKT
jgi:SAM-dependent methyltransferase